MKFVLYKSKWISGSVYSILIFYKQNICRRKQKYPHPVAMNTE